MRFFKALGLVALVTSGASLLHAQAFQFVFDEQGNATYVDSQTPTQNGYTAQSGTANYFTTTDPFGDVTGQILVYDLPELVFNGPVGIDEFGGGVGDVLWFTNQTDLTDAQTNGVVNGVNTNPDAYSGSDFGARNANLIIVYSDDVSTGYLADNGLPAWYPSDFTLSVGATENAADYFQYLADGLPYPNGNEYDGFSGTPEPASFSMLLIGVGAVGFGAWRRRRA